VGVGVGDSLGLFMTSEIFAREGGGVVERGLSTASYLRLCPAMPMKLARWSQWVAMPFRYRLDEDEEEEQQGGAAAGWFACNDRRPTGGLQARKMEVES